MHRPSPQHGAGNLHDDIGERSVPLNLTPQQEGERDKRIEMRPDTGPIAPISTMRMAPVSVELQNSASAALPPDSRSPMMPEPTMAASRSPGAQPFSSQPSRKTLRLHGLYAGSLEIALLVRPILSSSF